MERPKTKEELEAIIEAELSKDEYRDCFAVPVSSTHIMIGGAIVNAKEFNKAMREEFNRQYNLNKNK